MDAVNAAEKGLKENMAAALSPVDSEKGGLGHVETTGLEPIPPHLRTNTEFYSIGLLWFSMNANILPITFGMLATSVYGLSLRNASLVILFFTLFTTPAVAYLSVFGPRTGMRQMVLARYSFGRFVCLPVLLNLATLTGFCIIMAVIGGQCLSAVSAGKVSPAVGIVIVAILAMLISFFGFRVLHIFERWAWIPTIIAIAIATGVGSDKLQLQAVPEPATAHQVLSFGMIVASYMLPWGCIASDFSTYMLPSAPSWRIFWYTYFGLVLPTILLMTLGAAIGGAIANVPQWEELYDKTLVGGALAGMLLPLHGFGKFLVVILSFSLLGNLAATSYAISLNFQQLAPIFKRVPRHIYTVLLTAIIIPISIPAAKDFFVNLENFVALIGYWAAAFLAIIIAEHVFFAKQDYAYYDPAVWDNWSQLPLGVAAISSFLLSFALVIPCMEQVWYTGPIAKRTGDLGFEVAFFLAGILYVGFRKLENKYLK
ncbi:hypothetical protein TD95_003508 [Thielaviopsis punctulata]|uniref:Purine-cytosine permease n=1 Tax=Thielaviopsis punctulata TaxID=72032 RepID=A0A0F4Z707_9PEZI|nr:hypothetical protein TD95_003508 [Thielaviopsis punctulata]